MTETGGATGEWLSDPGVVVFARSHELPVGAVEQHGLLESGGALFGRTREAVRADWDRILHQLNFLLEEAASFTSEYHLEEISFSLGFSAEGRIVFIAQGGIQTTISVVFKRTQPDGLPKV